MHKWYLTKTECEIINGADRIIDEIGCFPSMENGRLTDIHVVPSQILDCGFDISLVFDITGWKEFASLPGWQRIPETNVTTIRLCFVVAKEIRLNSYRSDMDEGCCEEIKFSNTTDTSLWHQDGTPWNIQEIPRPFCAFMICYGRSLAIEFDEQDCKISAEIIR